MVPISLISASVQTIYRNGRVGDCNSGIGEHGVCVCVGLPILRHSSAQPLRFLVLSYPVCLTLDQGVMSALFDSFSSLTEPVNI